MISNLMPVVIVIVILAAVVVVLLLLFRTERATTQRVEEEKESLRDELARSQEQLSEQRSCAVQDQVRAEAEVRILNERLENQMAEREKLQRQFTDHFKNLANEILEDKSKRFTETNSRNIGDLLRPLGENIEKFRLRIEQESTQRQLLEQEIKRLHEMSNQVSREANNLASALRGNSKTQGDWGEMILETLLVDSGLQKGVHFFVQESFNAEDGSKSRPDVVVNLPDDKRMIVDSKVSLTAYVQYVEAVDDADDSRRKMALSAHVASVRKHITELSSKSYQKLTPQSPDFVIMFIPNEPAFMMALQCDAKLWNFAYQKKIILSSPTNLFAILKIVDDLWRRDKQDKHALEIAEQGGRLYDKFVGFTTSFLKIGETLQTTQRSYEKALGQLKDGGGNLVGQAEKLRKLGAKTSKRVPAALTSNEDDNDGKLMLK